MKIQQQIIDFLKEHDGATATEIMGGLGITRSPVGGGIIEGGGQGCLDLRY